MVPGVLPHGEEIACRSSACPGNGVADGQFWVVGSPEGGVLILPEVGNPQRTLCNRGR
jgi:hypothetical protein